MHAGIQSGCLVVGRSVEIEQNGGVVDRDLAPTRQVTAVDRAKTLACFVYTSQLRQQLAGKHCRMTVPALIRRNGYQTPAVSVTLEYRSDNPAPAWLVDIEHGDHSRIIARCGGAGADRTGASFSV
jgi:hypothetical protein